MPLSAKYEKARAPFSNMLNNVLVNNFQAVKENQLPLKGLLDETTSFIAENLDPEDVFGEDALEEWARGRGWAPVEKGSGL